MDLGDAIQHQRVKHIISSYQLAGEDGCAFEQYLDQLLADYPTAVLELAIVETIVEHWLRAPLLRGCDFLHVVHGQVKVWRDCSIASTITPDQFQHITGLDPSPIFGQPNVPSDPSRI